MTLPLIDRARSWPERLAIVAPEGVFSYQDLLESSGLAGAELLDGRSDLDGERVCFLVPPGWEYVVTQWAIWRVGAIAVPLAVSHPPPELAYVIEDTEPALAVVHPSLWTRLDGVASRLGVRCLRTTELLSAASRVELPDRSVDRASMILYTSGTTGRPKGVVLTHDNLRAQLESLTNAWGWTRDDHILLSLPLHHVHGIVNVLGCALWSGACCQILERFDARAVWNRIGHGDLTLYMAVPTIYRRLIQAWEEASTAEKRRWSTAANGLRLMVSGSAALPVSTLERWEEITGHRLLERYGMTEIGMALSNPLVGERRPGHVGTPLPSVEVRLVGEEGETVPEGTPGEIQVRGPGVFQEYWRRPRETEEAFTTNGWFRTGDQAVVEGGAFRILGRRSVDILKTGGEKVSALEIEDTLREIEGVVDCAVVGIPDADWGERVCAAVITRPSGPSPSVDELRAFAKSRLAPYKVPRTLLIVDELPRNAMGKVTKSEVRKLFDSARTE